MSGYDDVDGGALHHPMLSTGSSVPSDVEDLASPSPVVVGGGHPFDRSGSTPTSGSADAFPCSPQQAGDIVPEVRTTRCLNLYSPAPLFDWNSVDDEKFARLRTFLGQQDWAREYCDEDDGFHVVIRGISKDEARHLIHDHNSAGIPIILVEHSGGTFEECGNIKPGDRLINAKTEKQGIYSGSVGASTARIYGLTAAHTIQDGVRVDNEEVRLLQSNQPSSIVSQKDHVIKEVYRRSDPTALEGMPDSERITADVRFLYLESEVRSINTVQVVEHITNLPNGTYGLTVYQGSVIMQRHARVLVRNHRRVLIEGSILNASFTSKDKNLFHTITVVRRDTSPQPIFEPGDSGAPVWLASLADSKYAHVVGIVLGMLCDNQSKGVINNLGDVMNFCELFGTNPDSRGFYDKD